MACAEVLNNYFIDAVEELDIDRGLHVNNTSNTLTHVDKSITLYYYIEMFRDHPSVQKINGIGYNENAFSVKPVYVELINELINNIDSSKAYQKGNIPPKMFKHNVDICAIVIHSDTNVCFVAEGKFPSNLKKADTTLLFKQIDRLLKVNYRPISMLPTLSKIYEKVLFFQIYEYFDRILPKFLCGFRKGHSTQHCLLFMLVKLKMTLDRGNCTGILLTDLSKAFDFVSHELLIAKLNAYGFSKNSLNMINDYLSGRKQRTKVGEGFSNWREIIHGGSTRFHTAF